MNKAADRPGKVIYQSQTLSARFVDKGSDRIVVSFPDRVHPPDLQGDGWGEHFLTGRGISGVYINMAQIDWFQSPDFFSAMAAVRNELGADARITTYGSSMGGYAAILGAKTLLADLSLALVPQAHIDPETDPFETRYTDYARRIGPFRHDLGKQVSNACTYCVAYDPTHRLDPKHVALISRYYPVTRIPTYGAGHGVLEHWINTGCLDELGALLTGRLTARRLRAAIRAQRKHSPRYRRRMTKKASASGHANLVNRALQSGATGFSSPTIETPRAAGQRKGRQKKLLIHAGLPKTGTTSLQAHFFNCAETYEKSGVWYPTDGISRASLNHAWLSQGLRDADTVQLDKTLSDMPEHCATALLSDESLYVELIGLSENAKRAFLQATQGWTVNILLVERDKTDWKRSFYVQSIQNRRGGKPTPQPTARNLWQTGLTGQRFFEQPYVAQLLDFSGMHERFAAAFHARTVQTLEYSKHVDTINAFCDALGLQRAHGASNALHNPSLTDTEAEILRQANAMSPKDAWLIKALIEDKIGIVSGKIHQRRLMRALEPAKSIEWNRFAFTENPPLKLDRILFAEQVEELQRRTAILLSYAKQLT